MIAENRIMIGKCNGDCLELRPISEDKKWAKKGYYCALKRGDWDKKRIKLSDCKKCKHARYAGIERENVISILEDAMKRYAQDNEIFSDRELAECALNALLGE